MRVLITGGAGYIGSHTLMEVLAADHDVMVVDNFTNSTPAVLDRVARLSNRQFESTATNIGDASAMAEVFEKFQPEAVVHFAGLKAVGESLEKPLSYYQENVAGTISLLRVMDQAGCSRMVFSSSANIYGDATTLPVPETHPMGMTTNPYGRTKQMIEMIVSDWAAADANRSAMLLRYFNPVGAHPSGEMGEDPQGMPSNLMPLIARVAVGRLDHLNIYGDDYDTPDGTGIRDFIHVADLARGHLNALDYVAQQTGVEAVNLGTGQGHSVRQVINAFEAASGVSIPVKIAPRRDGDVAASFAAVDKARRILGWQAQCTLADMCADTWRWQSLHPNGYED